MMNFKESAPILENLKDLGFTEYEGKVYLCLITEHPLSAYSISKVSGVPHSRVYDITRRLIKKGFVTSKGTNPELFSPLAPEEMIVRIRKENELVTDQLKKQLSNIHFKADFDPVWNLNDRDEVLETSQRIIRQTKTNLFIGIWDEELEVMEDSLKKASNQGVKVNILLYGEAEPDFGILCYHSIEKLEDIEVVGRSLDLVSDGDVCLTGSLGARKPCQTVWTRNKGLIKSIEGYIIHDFYIAEMSRFLGDKTDEIFGRNFAKLRKKYGH